MSAPALGGREHPLFEKRSRFLVNDGAEVRLGVHRIAEFDQLGLFQDQWHEAVGDRLLAEDALHRGAALAGILGGAGHRKLRRLVEVGVRQVARR